MVNLLALLLAGAFELPVPATLLREPVRVEIVTDGSVETPPDRFRVTGVLITRGASLDSLQAEIDKHHAIIVREMAAMAATVSPPDRSSLQGFIGNEQYGDVADTVGSEPISLSDEFRFDVADRASADRVAAALKKDGVTKPVVSGILTNDTAAIDRARSAALTLAYAKAERTAASLGMHVSALRRISDQVESPNRVAWQLAETLGATSSASGNVVTRITLLVEFELTPGS
ncbi:SIMPL domain-containing protein [Sphingomonas sp. RT2P30]|uniref:SIMPL domain-containing protein n=1 Tax=Parasphingomonas halimpatiens TaxID=3096162 RepID=UPI002FCBABF2